MYQGSLIFGRYVVVVVVSAVAVVLVVVALLVAWLVGWRVAKRGYLGSLGKHGLKRSIVLSLTQDVDSGKRPAGALKMRLEKQDKQSLRYCMQLTGNADNTVQYGVLETL